MARGCEDDLIHVLKPRIELDKVHLLSERPIDQILESLLGNLLVVDVVGDDREVARCGQSGNGFRSTGGTAIVRGGEGERFDLGGLVFSEDRGLPRDRLG